MSLEQPISFTLNGVRRNAQVGVGTSALELLRDTMGLTGTKYGCGEGECGACTIRVDGLSAASCLMFAVELDGRSVTTVEGLVATPVGEALRQAFVAHGAVQCGFCTPGMMVQAAQLLERQPQPAADAVKTALEGNLCRCTGYQKIVEAVIDAGKALSGEGTR